MFSSELDNFCFSLLFFSRSTNQQLQGFLLFSPSASPSALFCPCRGFVFPISPVSCLSNLPRIAQLGFPFTRFPLRPIYRVPSEAEIGSVPFVGDWWTSDRRNRNGEPSEWRRRSSRLWTPDFNWPLLLANSHAPPTWSFDLWSPEI